MRIASFVLAGTLLPNAVVYGQLPARVYIAGEVTVTTSDSLVVTFVSVAGRAWRDNVLTAEKEFAFCVAHAKPLASRLNYKGKGRVVYRVSPDKPSTASAAGPEHILPALAVFHPTGRDGEAWSFLADGQAYPHPPNERSVGAMTTFPSAHVIRQDYVDRNGRRRGTDASSCVATAILALGQAIPPPTPTAEMRADVDRLVARAAALNSLWPWMAAYPEIDRVVRHGKAVAPLLVALLAVDPHEPEPEMADWRVQQNAALALCRIYKVSEECGHVYCNRTSREVNKGVRRFWLEKTSEPTKPPRDERAPQGIAISRVGASGF